MLPGVVVLDTSCYAHLVKPAVWERLNRSLRTAHLEARPTAINMFELLSTPNPRVRQRLLKTFHQIAAGRRVLPWPRDLLRHVGEAIRDGEHECRLAATWLDGLLVDPARSGLQQQRALAFCRRVETQFTNSHRDARKAVQSFLREHGIQDAWSSAAEFLDSQWSTPNLLGHFSEIIWRALQLDGAPPIDDLLTNDTWRLYLEAEGLAVFQRGIMRRQSKRVQRMDLLQLVYMSVRDRRILASADEPFLSAATCLLHRRYSLAEAVHIRALLDTAV